MSELGLLWRSNGGCDVTMQNNATSVKGEKKGLQFCVGENLTGQK
jgi:hypothetical protein